MKKYLSFFIIMFFVITIIHTVAITTDGEFIERNEEPRQLGYNLLEIYNYNGKPLIFFDGYHQNGAIYLGDFKEIEHLYNFSKLDFVLVDRNTSSKTHENFHFIEQTSAIELQDEDNSINVINHNTIVVELKRFKFIVSNQLDITNELQKADAQFFILDKLEDIEVIQESFSVEHIFVVNDEYPDHNPLVSVITDNFFVQFICNTTSYKFEYKNY